MARSAFATLVLETEYSGASMINRRFLVRLVRAMGLTLSGFLHVCAIGVADAKSKRCEDIFRSQASVLEQQRNLNLVRSAVVIDGRAVYYEHLRAKKGRETLVVFSGLFTPLSDFASFQVEFAKRSQGEGLIVISYSTQIESMIWSRVRFNQDLHFKALDLSDFTREVTAALNAENIRSPVSVLGYSYGAAPAAGFAEFHRDRVSNLIMVAPLIVPGDHNAQIHSSKEAYETLAKLNPLYGKAMIDSMREGAARNTATTIVENFMKSQLLPEMITKELVIEGLIAQIRAAEAFDLRNENAGVWPRTHFLLASSEHAYRLALQQALFDRIAAAAKSPGISEIVKDGQHTLLASNAEAAVEFVLRVMRESKPTSK